jgi:hypothetical protein
MRITPERLRACFLGAVQKIQIHGGGYIRPRLINDFCNRTRALLEEADETIKRITAMKAFPEPG